MARYLALVSFSSDSPEAITALLDTIQTVAPHMVDNFDVSLHTNASVDQS